MKVTTYILLLLVLSVVLSGCANVNITDRGRDAADVFTVSFGGAYGAKVRVGPLTGGLFLGQDKYGLRGGRVNAFADSGFAPAGLDATCTLISVDSLEFAHEDRRNKSYTAVFGPLGLFCMSEPPPAHYYTQIEVAAGLVGGVRLGLNPGEFVDFVLGWTTLDIYNDDLGTKRNIEQTGAANSGSADAPPD